jgi:outer membrane protein assembly factor BamB
MNPRLACRWLSADACLRLSRGVTLVTAGFSLLICLLLVMHYVQTETVDPLHSRTLNTLMTKLRENPGDEALREEIRALDLLSRKAYFTSRWQVRTGGYLLLASILVLLLALKLNRYLQRRLPDPVAADPTALDWWGRTMARKWTAVTGLTVLGVALAAGITAHSNLAREDIFTVAAAGPSAEELARYWTGFRGPGGNGVAAADTAPVNWDGESGTGVRWKVEVPRPGYSSPVVWRDRLFVTGADEEMREVFCYDADSGALLWRHEVRDIPGQTTEVPQIHMDTGYAPSTAVTDGRHVYAIFPTGDLVGLDLDGRRIWARNLGMPDNHYGHASSLLVFEDLLIVQWDQNTDARLMALDTRTGRPVWETKRTVISWSSPICVNTGSRMELILTNSTSVDAYDPRTGAKLWGQDCMSGEMGPSPAFADGMVFAANDYAVVAGLRLGAAGAEVAWEYDTNLPDTASPLATNKHVFVATSRGYVACLDAKSGKQLWEKDFGDAFYASPILVGSRVYVIDLQGVMHIFENAPEYRMVAEPALGEPSSSTPAFVDGRVYIRGDRHLFCMGS